jgi:hypothetical protein
LNGAFRRRGAADDTVTSANVAGCNNRNEFGWDERAEWFPAQFPSPADPGTKLLRFQAAAGG